MSEADENTKPTAAPAPSFEQALSDLQRIAADLESGALGLEESLGRFEEGVGLLRQCHTILERAEQKIELLTGADVQGQPTFAPFDGTATAAPSGAAAGRRPRKKSAKPEQQPTDASPAIASEEVILVAPRPSDPESAEDEKQGVPRLF